MFFTEIAPLFPDSYFHIGGDENEGKHWDENKKIQDFKKLHNIKDNHELQTYFNSKVQQILKDNGKIMMGWDEIFQPSLPKDVVIHSWRGTGAMLKAAKLGYKTILSKGYYIDLLESAKLHYTNEPFTDNHGLTDNELKNILGGEATMWSELVTPLTIDSRIWPRTAAIAERFWSDKTINDVSNMFKRLEVVSYRLEELGITHIKNRDVILRNISNNQNLTSLINLTKICEPLKAYQRNKGGTQYKSFSPFTQFADACNTDAIDVMYFNENVDEFLKNHSKKSKNELLKLFKKWIQNNVEFIRINNNPTLNQLSPLSLNLANLSSILIKGLEQNKLNKGDYDSATELIKNLHQPIVDTELAINSGLERLILIFNEKSIKY